jgi:hypothetical protein
MFFDGKVCGPVKIAYEVESGIKGHQLPFEALAPFLRKSIEHRCALSPSELAAYEGDAVRWASDRIARHQAQNHARCR